MRDTHLVHEINKLYSTGKNMHIMVERNKSYDRNRNKTPKEHLNLIY